MPSIGSSHGAESLTHIGRDGRGPGIAGAATGYQGQQHKKEQGGLNLFHLFHIVLQLFVLIDGGAPVFRGAHAQAGFKNGLESAS